MIDLVSPSGNLHVSLCFMLYAMMEKHVSICQVICSQYIKRSAASVTHPACFIFTHDPLLVYDVILDFICWGVLQDTAYMVTIYRHLSVQWSSLPNNSMSSPPLVFQLQSI